MRPIRPEPSECPKIKKAMRAARFMKWGATPLSGLALLAAVIIGVTSEWYYGVMMFDGVPKVPPRHRTWIEGSMRHGRD
jgi:hypothetical protein